MRKILLYIILFLFVFPVLAENGILYKAIIKGDVETVKTLLEQGEDSNQRDEYQIPLLNHAVNFQQYDMVKLLIHLGTDVNQADKIGWTPLIVASTYGYEQIAKLLIKSGAKIALIADDGVTAISQANAKNNKSLEYLLIKQHEIQQQQDLGVPSNLAYQLHRYRQEIGIKNLPKQANYKTVEDVVSAFKRVRNKQGESIVLMLLNLNQHKQHTSLANRIKILQLAQRYIDPEYWFASFSLYRILDNDARFRMPLRDMHLQTQTLAYLIQHFDSVKALIINNTRNEIGHIQPDVSLEVLLRSFKQYEETDIFKQYNRQVDLLLEKLEKEKIEYSFDVCVATLSSPDTAGWIKDKVRYDLASKTKRNDEELFHIMLPDWKNDTYIYIDMTILADKADTLIAAIKKTPMDEIYKHINQMRSPNKEAVWQYLQQVYDIRNTEIKKLDFMKVTVKGKDLLKS